MALRDFESFLRERVLMWDPNVDTSSGSPFDVRVVQPLLSRIGKDPFTTNLPLFIRERLAQEFPNMGGDVLTDLLVKSSEVLLDPIVRETNRIALSQSIKDPALLTMAEAEALGANYFSSMKKGDKAKVIVRVWFASPRSMTVNPSDYAATNGGLLFMPTSVQSIKTEEMQLNRDGSEYYFNINTEAELAGDQYNVEPGSIISISNVSGYTRVTNLLRASAGTPADSTESYIGRLPQELSEKSLNTMRGTVSLLVNNFSDITRVAVVGMNDPEMHRDILRGGGMGEILQTGVRAAGFPDGESRITTRCIRCTDVDVDFTASIGPVGVPSTGFGITLINAFDSGSPKMQDLHVARVIDSNTLELREQVIVSGTLNATWALRRINITLSGIPGGIVFSDGPNGTTEVRDSEVHIGGCSDIFIQGSSFSESTLVLDNVSDDISPLSGTRGYAKEVMGSITPYRYFVLADYTYYDNNYSSESNYKLQDSDPVYQMLQKAAVDGDTLKIMYPASMAGTYRIVTVIQDPNDTVIDAARHPVVVVDKDFVSFEPIVATWKVQDIIDVDLLEPKETRWSAHDGRSYVGLNYLDTSSGTDFDVLGVGAGDILRLHNGSDKGDYTVQSIGGAGNQRVYVTVPIKHSGSSIAFTVFRANKLGGVVLPVLRPKSIKILDSSQQPTGTVVPYGPAIYAQSLGFANNAHGVKLALDDVCLGIVGCALPLNIDGVPEAPAAIVGKMFTLAWDIQWVPGIQISRRSITIIVHHTLLSDIVIGINNDLAAAGVSGSAAYTVGGNRLGIAPIGPNTSVTDFFAGSAWSYLFGSNTVRWASPITSKDIRSDYVSTKADASKLGWNATDIDRLYDGIDIVSGGQVGYHNTCALAERYRYYPYAEVTQASLLVDTDLYPEADVHVNIGYRSIGVARTYFMDPVTVSFNPSTTFKGVTKDGIDIVYAPDPSNYTTKIPAYPSTTERKDGQFLPSGAGVITFNSQSTNFIEEVQTGDELVIRREWLTGTAILANDIVGLAGKILVFTVGSSSDIIVQFTSTTTSLTQTELVDQLNSAVGYTIAYITTSSLGEHLSFKSDEDVVIKHKVGASYANIMLGLAVTSDQTNTSQYQGTFYVELVLDEHNIRLRQSDFTKPWWTFSTARCIHFSVVRHSTQRISATEMSKNITPEGLYYCDVQLVSNGVGDMWNILPEVELVPSGYKHFGYDLVARDPNMTFSMNDQPTLRLPPVIYPVGTNDSPLSALRVANQNVQLTYETSALVSAVQDFCLSELERVVNMSPLVRHLIPYFVRMAVTYTGGAKESLIKPALEKYIKSLFPDDSLTVDVIMNIIKSRGASDIVSPLSLYALVYNFDRSVWAELSKDRLNTGRLAAFVPDFIKLTRQA